jgi:hypothetical protein
VWGVAAHQGCDLGAGEHASGGEFEGAADQLVGGERDGRDLGDVAVVHEGHRRVLRVGHREHTVLDRVDPIAGQALHEHRRLQDRERQPGSIQRLLDRTHARVVHQRQRRVIDAREDEPRHAGRSGRLNHAHPELGRVLGKRRGDVEDGVDPVQHGVDADPVAQVTGDSLLRSQLADPVGLGRVVH